MAWQGRATPSPQARISVLEVALTRAIEAIPVEHLDVEDCWYSCALISCGRYEPVAERTCDCGASERQALVAELRLVIG
jgi:hypothetical protein